MRSPAFTRNAGVLMGGMNTGRHKAYGALLAEDFRLSPLVGVRMHRPADAGYDRPDVFVIDDWR